MSWKDRMLIKIMGNKVVLKILSVPIVMKILTIETKIFLWITSPFMKKKADEQAEQSQPSDSGNTPAQ